MWFTNDPVASTGLSEKLTGCLRLLATRVSNYLFLIFKTFQASIMLYTLAVTYPLLHERRLTMKALKLAVGMLGMSVANLVLAGNLIDYCRQNPTDPQCVGVNLPMDDVGLIAVAAVLLVTGIKIIRQKRSR